MSTSISFTPIGSSGAAAPSASASPTGTGNISFTPVAGSSSAQAPSAQAPAPDSGGPIAAPFPATGTEGPAASAGKMLGNFIPSAANFAASAAELPFQGAKALTQIPAAAAGAVKDSGGVLPAIGNFASSIIPTMHDQLIPDVVKKGEMAVAGGIAGLFPGKAAVGSQLVDKGLTGMQADVENNPVGSIAPLLMLGKATAGSISPEASAAFDSGVSKMAAPATTAGSALRSFAGATGGKIGGVTRFGVGQAMGLEPATLQEVIKNPAEWTAAKMAQTTRVGVASIIKNAIDAREDQLSESGGEYGPIRQGSSPITVSSGDLAKMVAKGTGMEIDSEGRWNPSATSPVDAPTDVSKVQRLYDAWQPKFDAGKITPGEFLTLRGKLATIANYEGIGKSSPLEGAAASMRSDLNTNYRDQVPGLEDIDADFSSQKAELKTLSNGLLDKDGNLRDSDINKIANATGKSRAVLLGNLEQLSPGITDKINALKAIEDIQKSEGPKVGTYARTAGSAGAMLTGIATGNVPLLVGGITEAVLTSPAVAIPLLRAYGYSKALTAGVVANLSQIASKANNLPNAGSSGSLSPFSPGAASQTFNGARLTGTKQ